MRDPVRRLLLAVLWLLAVSAIVLAVGLRVRAHRRADPVQVLHPYLGWMPEGFAGHAVLVGRSRDRNGLSLQFEIDLAPADIRVLAARNRMQEVEGQLIGAGAMRWQVEPAQRPGAVVHLLLPDGGGIALLTVVDPHPE